MSYQSLKTRERLRRYRPVPQRDAPDGKPAGFRAEWSGTCALCGRDFKTGDALVMWSRPRVCHRACVPEA